MYRSFCHEHHLKRDIFPSIKISRSLIDRGKTPPEQLAIQSDAAVYQQAVEFGIAEQIQEKKRLDRELKSRDFSEWSHWIVYGHGECDAVTSQMFHPGVDLNGKRLQAIEDFSTPIEPVFINTALAGEENFAIVFSWRKDHMAAERFLDVLFSIPDHVLPHVILFVFFTRCENVFFSKRWWEKLNDNEQRTVKSYCEMTNDLDWVHPVAAIELASWNVERKRFVNHQHTS